MPHTILVLGAGALGSYYGARLAQAGHPVHFLLRSEYDAVRAHGLRVSSIAGDFHLPPTALHLHRDPATLPQPDLLLVTLKTTANPALDTLLPPLLKPTTAVLTLQNGLGNEDRLAALASPGQVIGGIAFVCINREPDGVVRHTAEGLIKIGDFAPDAVPPARLTAEAVGGWFAAANVPCKVVPDVRRVRWEKLVWNVPFNGLGAALDLTTADLLASPHGESLVRQLMAEVISVAAAEGHAFTPETVERQIAITRPVGAYRTSMQIDRQLGREMEIDAIVGEVARRATSHNLHTPALHLLLQQLRAVQNSRS